MENQVVKVERHRLEALANGIESCVSLWRDGADSKFHGQRPDEMLLGIARSVKGWIQNSCGKIAQSQSKE